MSQPIDRRVFTKSLIAKALLASIAGGMAVSGLGGGPGANSPGLIGAFVEKNPSTAQEINPTQDVIPLTIKLFPNGANPIVERLVDPVTGNYVEFNPTVPYMNMVNQNPQPNILITLMRALNNFDVLSFNPQGITGNPFIEIGTGGTDINLNSVQQINLNIGGSSAFTLDLTSGLTPNLSWALLTAGAQVGQPTGTAGSPSSLVASSGHRHAFSGRFTFSGTDAQAILPGGAFPDNFARIKINNNWTLRRIWAYTKNGPTGGTETYGVVTAAGALQGTAVILPAGPGVSQAESALQATNLTGGTLYYLAQTAAGALVTVASTNVEVGIEYTMNV